MKFNSFGTPPSRAMLVILGVILAFGSNAQSGSKEIKPNEQKFFRHIISVAPWQATDLPGHTIGIEYEHFLDEKTALYLPVAICFLNDHDYPSLKGTYTYFYPGFKFYPVGSGHLFSYSIGPSLALGYGDEFHYADEPWVPTTVSKSKGVQAGLMINNGLNIRPERFYFGAELGLGMSLSNPTTPVFGGIGLLLQFQFKAGYCF